jgi:hypothetical protein
MFTFEAKPGYSEINCVVSPKVGLCPIVDWTESHFPNDLMNVPVTTTSFCAY